MKGIVWLDLMRQGKKLHLVAVGSLSLTCMYSRLLLFTFTSDPMKSLVDVPS